MSKIKLNEINDLFLEYSKRSDLKNFFRRDFVLAQFRKFYGEAIKAPLFTSTSIVLKDFNYEYVNQERILTDFRGIESTHAYIRNKDNVYFLDKDAETLLPLNLNKQQLAKFDALSFEESTIKESMKKLFFIWPPRQAKEFIGPRKIEQIEKITAFKFQKENRVLTSTEAFKLILLLIQHRDSKSFFSQIIKEKIYSNHICLFDSARRLVETGIFSEEILSIIHNKNDVYIASFCEGLIQLKEADIISTELIEILSCSASPQDSS